MADHLLVDTADFVRTARLNRPDKKNALTQAMYTTLAEVIEGADADPDVRVVVIGGSGGTFTAGNDLHDFMNPAAGLDAVLRFLTALRTTDTPIVAAVDGPAVGVGTTLLLHCDFAYATARSYLKTPFTELGLVPEAGSSQLLPRWLGRARANQILLLSERIPADQAAAWGLLNAVVDDVDAAALSTARRLAALPPASIRASKRLLRDNGHLPLAEAMDAEVAVFGERLRSPEFAEATRAFVERRAPDFSSFE